MYQCDRAPNSRRLLDTEEEVLVKHVLDLDARGFPARLAAVEDMANSLRDARHLQPVGINWAATVVRRRPELRVKFNRKYDYKRALCKDPEIIEGWFRLIVNMKAKYGIQDEDTYNFDETGFMMGQILTGAVVTGSERRGRPKTVQQGNRVDYSDPGHQRNGLGNPTLHHLPRNVNRIKESEYSEKVY